MNDAELTRYEWYVLTEAIRLHEVRNGFLDDSSALALARQAKPDPEVRLVNRAMHLAREHGLLDATANGGGRPSVSSALFLFLCCALGGMFIGRSILSGAPGLINALGWVGALLIVQALGLLFWFLSFRFQLEGSRTLFPWIRESLERLFRERNFDLLKLQARAIIDEKNKLSRWRIGITVHSAWIFVYVAVLLTVLWILLLKRFDFVVESTILDDRYFAYVVKSLGSLPSILGFPVPSDLDIRNALDRVAGDLHARRAWGWWIIGVLSVWALLPRVLLWALCRVVVSRREAKVALDLDDPYYAGLRDLLFPKSDEPEVVDSDSSPDTPPVPLKSDKPMTGRPIIIGLEVMEQPWLKTLPDSVLDGGLIQELADQEHVRALLDRERPARLLIACNADLSPDRGSLKLIADYSARSGQAGVLLVKSRHDEDSFRLLHWKAELLKYEIKEGNVFTDQGDAFTWLQMR